MAIAPQYMAQLRIFLYIFKVSTPTIQRYIYPNHMVRVFLLVSTGLPLRLFVTYHGERAQGINPVTWGACASRNV